MIQNNKNEVLLLKPLKNCYDLPRLLNGFRFNVDPDDKEVKSININTVSLYSFNELLRVVVHVEPMSRESIKSVIDENNLVVHHVEFRIAFQDGHVEFAKVMHDDITRYKMNPIIDKYLKYWEIPQS